ncbi:MAG: class I SAM-dependent methyltransferase [Candidatus Thermoplasmatota archaeon]|nr:class I SAM-dependent methyltransferase [Candidatus Thermoplasmatota archaeon]MEC8789135.1 class I SAM-dependent methyltransferase [Candidatus Thermoplasmatota archaeon]
MEKKAAVDVFSQWALIGKDEGMERGHSASVQAMLELAVPKLNDGFSAIDLGCGNGWVTRMLSELGAGHSEGVDGSNEMINKATSKDSNHKYSQGLLPDWSPGRRFDLVHTMEFLYYLDDPAGMISIIHDEWLEENGILVAGVDHYLEHEESLTWPEHVGVHMTTLSIDDWKSAMVNAGFKNVEIHQVAGKENFPGTLVMLGQASHQ